MPVDPHADALRPGFEYARWRDGILPLQGCNDGAGVEPECGDFPGREFQVNHFVLCAENVDFTDIRHGHIFRTNFLDSIAQLALAQTIAGESVDVAEHVPETIIEKRSDDALRKIPLDVGDHVAHANPGRGDVAGLGAVAQIDEDRRLPATVTLLV